MKHSAKGEYECIKIETYMQRANAIRAYDPQIDTIILTSEDESIIQSSKNFTTYNGVQWRFVYNVGDIRQGTGSATALQKETDHGHSIHRIMESALTSMHLQLRAKYMVSTHTSSWLLLIQALFKCDSCTFTNNRQSFWMSVDSVKQWFC